MRTIIIAVLKSIQVIPQMGKFGLFILDQIIYWQVIFKREKPYSKKMQMEQFYALRALYHSFFANYQNRFISHDIASTVIKSLGASVFFQNPETKRIKSEFYRKYNQNPPTLVTISPTKLCNLECAGCYSSSNANDISSLKWNTLDTLMNQLHYNLGMRFYVISGGEPFLYKSQNNSLFDLLGKWKKSYFMIYTNGTLINESTAAKLSECRNATPAISVEGFEKETDNRRGEGTFRKILQAISNLKFVGVPFGISVTVTKQNINILLEDRFYEYYFESLGASYMWFFHLMPIGKALSSENVITPEQRVELFKKQREILHKKRFFIADFWNSAIISHGCIACGAANGYFYINWDGKIMPCVFIPYYIDNIYDLFQKGKSIEDALFSNLFISGREFQQQKIIQNNKVGNLLMPCLYRDHHREFIDILKAEPVIKFENLEAEKAFKSQYYHDEMIKFDKQLERLTKKIWEEEY